MGTILASLALLAQDPSVVREAVVAAWLRDGRADEKRIAEQKEKAIRIGGKVMRYALFRVGEKPKDGYPLYIALHGGGGAPTRLNDSQWRQMQAYYRASVKSGIYVAPRGMTDTWNLHFVAESYAAYDRLIENMILFEGVDPDRVTLTGFSAGGDGVYQLAPRMADRWAAANMSAGHPNGVSPGNLLNVPFQLQVGEVDRAYNRNQEAAKYAARLAALAKEHPGGYEHRCNIHVGRPHNFPDNDPKRRPYRVIADPKAWLNQADRTSAERDTNAITWLERHERDPHPSLILWETKVGAASRGRRDQLRYWLDRGEDTAERIVARLETAKNRVVVEACGSYLKILLSEKMVDLAKPVIVTIGGRDHRVRPKASRSVMERTLRERGDPSLLFEAEVTIRKEKESWRVTAGEGS